MTDVTSAAYPQKVEHPTTLTGPADLSLVGPSRFKFGGNVPFDRAAKVLSFSTEAGRIRLQLQTRRFVNFLAQTHETRMHQFRAEEATGTLDFEIVFWSDSIFRVRFGAIPTAVPAFPPAAARMLIGQPDPATQVQQTDSPTELILQTAQVRLVIQKDPFALRAYDAAGKLFWQQARTGAFTSDTFETAVATLDNRAAAFESFHLHPQEEIFGLGERFDYLPRRGIPVDFWNKDAIGVSHRRTYINVPFLFSTHGYGLFVNSTARTEWEVGTLEASSLGFAVEDGHLDYFIIHGATPLEIIQRYCGLTGFSPTPPVWSFGLWMSRNSYESWDVVDQVVAGCRERDIPLDVIHLDTYWFQQDWNCDLKFATDRFAQPEARMAALKEQGVRVSLWQYNYVPPRPNNVNYQEGMAKGYFAKDANGQPYAFPTGTGAWVDGAVIDFSNPDATSWYTAQIKHLIEQGAAAIKTDFGEGIPEDALYHGIDGRQFHNLYSLVYNAALAQTIHEVTGEWIVWARSGTAGSQRFPIHWGGDSYCNWGNLAGTLRGVLSLGLSGFPFSSLDIGGFIGRPTPELYIRWAQFGLLVSHARCHGCGNDNSREPWTFGPDADRIFRAFTKLRYRLMPYLYHHARRASTTAQPLCRALLLDYPQDRNVWRIDDQYLLGDSLLIAPIFQPLAESSTRTLYLPEGTWIDYWTKETITSRGQWITRPVDLDTIPIFVKAGAILPYTADRTSTFNQVGPVTILEVYTGANNKLDYNDGTTTFRATLTRNRLKLTGLTPLPQIVSFGPKPLTQA